MIISLEKEVERRFKLNLDDENEIPNSRIENISLKGVAKEMISNRKIRKFLISFVTYLPTQEQKRTKHRRKTFATSKIIQKSLGWIVAPRHTSVTKMTCLSQVQSEKFQVEHRKLQSQVEPNQKLWMVLERETKSCYKTWPTTQVIPRT